MNDTRRREQQDAPELGADVWLVECTVDELLPLFEKAATASNADLVIATLAVSLVIDGRRWTEAELRNLPAGRFRALMKLGRRALQLNAIVPDEEAGEDEEKKA